MSCLLTLLAAFAVIAASLLGGCSDNAYIAAGPNAAAPAPVVGSDRASTPPTPAGQVPAGQVPAGQVAEPVATSQELGQKLASAALDDAKLSDVRGGFDTSSGVSLNFAFQQATFVNHNLTESVVVPTLTISPVQGGVAVSGAGALSNGVHPGVSVGSLVGLGITGSLTPGTAGVGINSATVVTNGGVQTQIGVSTAALQALVNSGLASVVGTGNGGITTTLANTANNQLIQQATTVDIGVSGLSKLIQQSVPVSIMSRLAGPSAFR